MNIEGVQIHHLTQIPDDRGKIMHMLRRDDPWFQQFGEIYFSVVYPGIVKGWHLHKTMTLNYAVVFGNVKLVLCDKRLGSITQGLIQEVFLGEGNYSLVTIPPLIWNGFKGLGTTSSIVANCATQPHDPSEIIREDSNFIRDYRW